MITRWIDPVRWFDALGNCGNCGKPGTGKLMGPRNESYGVFCTKCAERRIAAADKQWAKEGTVNAKL